MILGIGDVVALVVDREPAPAQPAIVELDLLRHPAAQRLHHEIADFSHVERQQVEMVDAARRTSSAMIALGYVLQLGLLIFGRLVDTCVVVQLEDMPIRVGESIGPPMSLIVIDPADAAPHALDNRHPPRQRFRRRCAICDMTDARGGMCRELQRMEFIIVEGPQPGHAIAHLAGRETIDPGEEIQAFREFVGVKLDMTEMGNVE